MATDNDLPPARESIERLAQRIMAEGLTPEEYAGRHGGNIYACSLHRYRYQDDATTAYIHRLGELLTNHELLVACQKQYLTPGEWDALQDRQAKERADWEA